VVDLDDPESHWPDDDPDPDEVRTRAALDAFWARRDATSVAHQVTRATMVAAALGVPLILAEAAALTWARSSGDRASVGQSAIGVAMFVAPLVAMAAFAPLLRVAGLLRPRLTALAGLGCFLSVMFLDTLVLRFDLIGDPHQWWWRTSLALPPLMAAGAWIVASHGRSL